MSCEGVTTGLPSLGFKMLLEASINNLASACASLDNGTWTAIWSPSKSALNAGVTSGCRRIALPSISLGSNAWMPSLCNVGARFNKTGCSLTTFSKAAQTSSSIFSYLLFAFFFAFASLPVNFCNSLKTNGLNKMIAISLGIPHWYISKSGPTIITERPE